MPSAGAAEAFQPAPEAHAAVKPVRSADHLLLLADRYRWWVLAAILGVYLLGFNGQWRIEPDSALYLSIARNLATGQGYTYHGEVDHLVYPGLPWLEAATFRLFGVGALRPIHMLMLGFALAAVALTYRLFLLHAGRGVAVVVATMVAFNHSFYEYAFQLRNDMPFLVGVLGVLAGFEGIMRRPYPVNPALADRHRSGERRALDILLLMGGLVLAIVMRPMMLPLIGVLVAACAWRLWRSARRDRRWVWGVCILAAVLMGCLFVGIDPRENGFRLGGYEQSMADRFMNLSHLMQTLHQTWHVYIPQIFRSVPAACFGLEPGPGLNLVAAVLLVALGIHLWRRRPLWGMWVAATVGILLFTLPRDRYFLPILPLLAYAWWRWLARLNRRMDVKWGNLLFCALLTLWIAPNTVRVIDVVIKQRSQPFMTHYKRGKLQGIQNFAERLDAAAPPSSVIIAPEGMGRILTYLSGRIVLDPWEWPAVADSDATAYCVQPADAEDPLTLRLDAAEWSAGPVVLSVPRGSKRVPWTLHRLVPLPDRP